MRRHFLSRLWMTTGWHLSRCLRVHVPCCLLLLVVPGACLVHAQPANDDCALATAVIALPTSLVVDTTGATSAGDDPSASCAGIGVKSVWFTFTAPRDLVLGVDTSGTDYGVALSAWTGSCGALVERACDVAYDATPATITIPLTAGESVLIEVADVLAGTGGNLVLQVDRSDALNALGTVVASGDPSPLGGAFADLSSPALQSATDVAFLGSNSGVFVRSGGSLVTIAVSGDPAPIGGAFAVFGTPVVSSAGEVAFFARTESPLSRSGIFLWNGTSIVPLVVVGDPVMPGGSVRSLLRSDIAINAAGDIAFFATTSEFGSREGLFVKPAWSPTAFGYVLERDVNPCGTGFLTSIGRSNPPGFAMNDLGEVVFQATGTGGDGVFVASAPGMYAPVVCEGQPAPIGGTFRSFGRQPVLNNAGDVVFQASVVRPGPDSEGLFLASPLAGVSALAVLGSLTSTGESFSDFSRSLEPAINDLGQVAFEASLSGVGHALLSATLGGGPPTAVVRPGGACGAAGSFTAIGLKAALNAGGDIVFPASCTGGAGVFLLPSAGAAAPLALTTDATAIGAGFTFDHPSLNGAGDVTFGGTRVGAFARRCRREGCEPLARIAAPLDAVPGLPDESIDGVLALAGSGREAALVVETRGASRREVVLATRNGSLATVAVEGDAVPGGGDTFQTFLVYDAFAERIALPSVHGRSVAFLADGLTASGIYFKRGRDAVTVARAGDLAPDGTPYNAFSGPAVSGGTVAFVASTDLATCVFLFRRPGVVETLTCEGDAAPPAVGDFLGSMRSAPVLVRGLVTFLADTVVGTCILTRRSSGALQIVACEGDPAPGGDQFEGFRDSSGVSVLGGSGGRIVSLATLTSGSDGIFTFKNGVAAAVATSDGSVASPLGGRFGTFASTVTQLPMRGPRIAFEADIVGGQRLKAIFLAQFGP